MAVRTYDAARVAVTVNGVNISGFGEATFVSVEREEENFVKVVGADGNVSRSKTNNKSGSLTITLQQTSPSNDVLSGLAAKDEATSDAIFPVIVKDVTGGSRIFSATGWMQGVPVIEFAKEISTREWIIDLADIEFNISGNNTIGGRNDPAGFIRNLVNILPF